MNRTDVQRRNIHQRRSIKLANHKNEAAIVCYQISGSRDRKKKQHTNKETNVHLQKNRQYDASSRNSLGNNGT